MDGLSYRKSNMRGTQISWRTTDSLIFEITEVSSCFMARMLIRDQNPIQNSPDPRFKSAYSGKGLVPEVKPHSLSTRTTCQLSTCCHKYSCKRSASLTPADALAPSLQLLTPGGACWCHQRSRSAVWIFSRIIKNSRDDL